MSEGLPTAAIILAAGKSTRMCSKLPKPLQPVCGLPLTSHVVRACQKAGIERIVVVVGYEAERVKQGLTEAVEGPLEFAHQALQRGTGDAVSAAKSLLGDWKGDIVVLVGDIPLLPASALRAVLEKHRKSGAAATLLTAITDDPTGYGRVIRNADKTVSHLVEERDASPEERAVKEWNPSIYAFQSSQLWAALEQVEPNNAQGEFYFTDTVGVLTRQGKQVEAVAVADARFVLGANNKIELAQLNALMREQILRELMISGVTIVDPLNTYIESDVEVGQDTIIEPNVTLKRGTKIGADCLIGLGSRIEASVIGHNVQILSSQIVGSTLKERVKVGPFANLRPGTHLGVGVKVGDFVEIKNSTLEAGAQAAHLTYIGDATVGAGSNIGGGTITCNYDGFLKHKTTIGKGVFVGSHSTLIAPVTVHDGAFIAAASSITDEVPEDALAIARARQENKEGWAKRFREKQEAKKLTKDA